MKVSDIMTKVVKVTDPEDLVKDVALAMTMDRISGMPVVNGKELVGMISEKDILQKMFPDMGDLTNSSRIDFETIEGDYTSVLTAKVGDVMTSPAWSISSDMPCLKAAAELSVKGIRRIPVVDNGKLVGIVSIGDIHRAIFKESLKK
jgi:CBS domain-containing protein